MSPSADLTPEQAAAVLTAALSGPGAESVLASFASVPGVVFVPARGGGFLRRGEPARLDAGQWRFVAGDRLRVSHVVRDVVLKTSLASPVEGGRLLADALLDATGQAGPVAVSDVQAVLYGMAVVQGLV
ncbi:MAG TPA: DUF5073 family protein [Pseudonocardia sp.]|nr:DUF5073 family protein [Pseudonocardia sp.]